MGYFTKKPELLCIGGGGGDKYLKTVKLGTIGANFILVYCYHSSDYLSSIEILNFFGLRVL
jgi:hypothetical protein